MSNKVRNCKVQNSSGKPGRKKVSVHGDILLNLGKNLRSLREAHNYSLQETASILGVSYQQIQKYESGQNRIPIESLITLKKLYDIDYELLFQDTAYNIYNQNISERARILNKLSSIKDKNMQRKIIQAIDILCT